MAGEYDQAKIKAAFDSVDLDESGVIDGGEVRKTRRRHHPSHLLLWRLPPHLPLVLHLRSSQSYASSSTPR